MKAFDHVIVVGAQRAPKSSSKTKLNLNWLDRRSRIRVFACEFL